MEKEVAKLDELPVELLTVRDGKYLVKFPFLEVPVELGDQFYKTYFEN